MAKILEEGQGNTFKCKKCNSKIEYDAHDVKSQSLGRDDESNEEIFGNHSVQCPKCHYNNSVSLSSGMREEVNSQRKNTRYDDDT
jgi:hypothetical protein